MQVHEGSVKFKFFMSNFKYDTHVHTSETSRCGKIDAETVVRLYKNAGYHGIVITDHYIREFFENMPDTDWNKKIDRYLSGYNKAFEEGKRTGLTVILGMELRFEENINDYLVYGFDKEFLYDNPMLYKMNIESFKQFIENTPLLVYQAHPFRTTSTPANPKYLHGIEIYNGNPRADSHNQLAFDRAVKYNLKMLSGSDFHREEDLARGGIILNEAPADSLEFAGIIGTDSDLKLITE